MLVGAGETGIALLKVINAQEPPPYQVLGVIDDDPIKQGMYIENYPVVGGSDCLLHTTEQEEVVELLVAISGEMHGGMFQALLEAQERGILITRMPVAYEEILGRIPIHHLEANWILRTFVDHARSSRFYELTKRIIDLLGGLVGVGLTVLFFPLVAIATLIDSGRPILYLQTRAGSGGQPYHMIKFRTMFQDAEADGQPQWATENDERATRVGRILRKTHLDELPQFINVLRGEMSLVGPRAERPELVDYFQEYVPFYRARLLIKPGITGWAQINYGYAVTIEDTATKLEYDLYYIKNRNILLDLLIVLRTIASVFGLRGR
jgi:exopolysaccharide biosynthesis polyprenyl glycosylphosphotransferase